MKAILYRQVNDRGGSVLRYERGQRVAQGGALVQRHVALPQDLANKEGKGLLVRPPFTKTSLL